MTDAEPPENESILTTVIAVIKTCKMEVIKINELLCYLFAKYGKMLVESIKCVIASFYEGDEIMAAKDLLFKCSGDLNLDGAPRCVNRRKDNKKSKILVWQKYSKCVIDIFPLVHNVLHLLLTVPQTSVTVERLFRQMHKKKTKIIDVNREADDALFNTSKKTW